MYAMHVISYNNCCSLFHDRFFKLSLLIADLGNNGAMVWGKCP